MASDVILNVEVYAINAMSLFSLDRAPCTLTLGLLCSADF